MNTTLTDWNIQDYLKTPEDRAFYIEAAIEEAVRDNDMRFLAEAFGDVARAVGNGKVAVFMSGISTGMKSMPTAAPPGADKTAPRARQGIAHPARFDKRRAETRANSRISPS